MKFYKVIEQCLKENKIDLYVDMDGCIAEYDIGNFDYETIRPLKSTIKKLEDISSNKNITIYILSVCKTDEVVEQKKIWIKKYLPFMSFENVILISKENELYNDYESKELKSNYLKNNIDLNKVNIVVDDDNDILKYLRKNNQNLILFQDSSLVD